MDGNGWRLNTGFIKPQQSVGIVVVNTKVSRAMMREACSNPTPLFGPAEGQYKDMVGDMRRGDVIWTYHDQSGQAMDCMIDDPMNPHRDSTTVHALAVLNGQGQAGSDPSMFEQTVRILGVAEVDKLKDKDRNTTAVGGIMTVRNNGSHIIRTGNTVWCRARMGADAKAAARTTEEKAGLLKFHLEPYSPEMHRVQPAEMYKCLLDRNDSKPYLPEYRRHCRQHYDSHLGTAMVAIGTDLDKFREVVNRPGSKAAVLKGVLEYFGHSEFSPGRKPGNQRSMGALFAPYSRGANNAVPFLFPGDAADELQRRLNRVQTDSLALGIMSTARLVDTLNNLIIGEAKSTAHPGEDFSLELCGYSKK